MFASESGKETSSTADACARDWDRRGTSRVNSPRPTLPSTPAVSQAGPFFAAYIPQAPYESKLSLPPTAAITEAKTTDQRLSFLDGRRPGPTAEQR